MTALSVMVCICAVLTQAWTAFLPSALMSSRAFFMMFSWSALGVGGSVRLVGGAGTSGARLGGMGAR